MKNVYLNITHTTTTGHKFKAEKNGDNLVLNLHTECKVNGTDEISVRIFNSDFHHIAAGIAISKNENGYCLCLQTDYQLETRRYFVYVYCNGKSRWFGDFFLTGNNDATYEVRLKAIERHPEERFFADNLCSTKWWRCLKMGKFKEPLVRVLIERAMLLSKQMRQKKIAKIPNLLVTGESLAAKTFASMVLGGFVSGDDVSMKYCFSLSEITTGAFGWRNQEDNIKGHKVAIIEVSRIEYKTSTINMVNMLATIMRSDALKDCTFIIHGTEDDIEMMMDRCVSMKELFTDDSTFRISPDRSLYNEPEEEDEFMRLLEEFVSDNDDSDPSDDTDDEEELIKELAWSENELHSPNPNYAEFMLKEMIGLKRLKRDLEEAKVMAMFSQKRREFSLEADSECRNHMLFLGNPGTGKTTVANLIGKIYQGMGLLSKGHTIVTDRSKLMGEYIGQTEKNITEAIKQARGGVLFIDEAYNLVSCKDDRKDYGKEVINALLPVLSEPNPDMIVIFAGYEEKMKEMMKVNPGLKDRFPLCFHFDDYSASELMEIARQSLAAMNFHLTTSADSKLLGIMKKAVSIKDEYFGNGRWVRNLIEHGILKSMATRVMSDPEGTVFDERLLCTIEECDIIQAEKCFLNDLSVKISISCPIGFRV